ncbi:MAG: molybdopterin oxidoreductase [Bdellovibrionota bacterium]
MTDSHSVGEIRNPGTFQVSSGLMGLFAAMVLVGIGAFAFGLKSDPERAWAAYIHNHYFFMCLGLGGTFFAAIQWLTGAMWSAPVRRLSEAFTAYLPVALVTVAVLYFGIHHLFRWSHPEHVQGDLVLEGKSGYLSPGFFMIRNLIAVAVWIFFSWKLVGNSVLQDTTKSQAETLKNRVLSPIFLVLFALTFTVASFDQLMSLDAHWFSTMFGVYCFAGLFYANLASTCLLTLWLRSKGKLEGIVNDNHIHDLGKFMFAFTVFWAYIGFSQFMLIWYANLPEETEYYIRRFHENWFYVSVFLLVGKFMTPFFFLLPRDAKRRTGRLAAVGIFMLFAQWVDVMWMVQPEFFKTGPQFGMVEAGVLLGFAGLFGLAVSRFLSKHNIVAIGDPRLAESVFHHHQ